MSLSKEKREAAKKYLLTQIAEGNPDAIKKTSEVFEIDRTSVYGYIRGYINAGILKKDDKIYKLIPYNEETHNYLLNSLSEGMEDDIYRKDIEPLLSNLPENIQDIWRYTASEMINNAIDHSRAENITISIIQDYVNTTLLIMDDGVGIFNNIVDHYGFSSIDIAIEELFKGKLSTNYESHTGEGIFFTSRMMDTFAAISSGRAFTLTKDDDGITQLTESDRKGTVIYMVLSNFSNKTTTMVFDEYSNVDDGFYKTKLPIELVCGDYPVSRSQAKRLVKRFESFKEVVLDFNEVRNMGQGFGDELFRIYHREHPEVLLTPINMNENVQKMFAHVSH